MAPDALVDEFKRRGHFDMVRKQLLQQFQAGPHHDALVAELDARLAEHVDRDADRLAFRDARLRHAELLRHAERLSIVDSLGARLRDGRDADALLARDGPFAHTVAEHVAALVAGHAAEPHTETPQP